MTLPWDTSAQVCRPPALMNLAVLMPFTGTGCPTI
jgi:hypothetical protein